MSSQKPKALTYRVEGIHHDTRKEDFIRTYFSKEDHEDLILKSFCPSVDCIEGQVDSEYTATVLFRPRDPHVRRPRVQEDISPESSFMGFTPLYVPETGPIAADIIAVTGLGGHAFGSWAHSDERMWLRDYLPAHAPNARILTYGYSMQLHHSNSYGILQDHATSFVHQLVDIREESKCENRPIIFIGHSLGCLLIKKAITDAGTIGMNSSRFPVRAIIFLAGPHKGLDTTALQTLLANQPPLKMVKELEPGSPSLRDLNERFTQFAKDIDILSCYETEATKTVVMSEDGTWKREGAEILMVTPDSAQLYLPMETRVNARDKNHSTIAKINKGQSGIFSSIRATIRRALLPTADIVAETTKAADENTHNHKAYYTLSPSLSIALADAQQPRYQASFHEPYPAGPPPYHVGPVDLPQTKLNVGTYGQGSPPVPPPLTAQMRTPPPVPPRIFDQRSANALSPPALARPSILEQPIKNQSMPGGSFQERSVAPQADIGQGPIVLDIRSTRNLHDRTGRGDEDGTLVVRDEMNPQVERTPVAKCMGCYETIPNETFHHRCGSCMSPGDEDRCYCQQCYDGYSLCEYHDKKLVKLCVKARASAHHYVDYIDIQVNKYDTNITKAIKDDNWMEISREKLRKTQLNARDDEGRTPLHLAAQLGRDECATALLEAGALKESRDRTGTTPLLTAIEYDHISLVRVLLDHKVDVDHAGGPEAVTPLCYAAMYGQSDIVRLLLEYHATTDVQYDQTRSALHYAASTGDEESVSLLLEAGAKLNAREERNGETPLHEAVVEGHLNIINQLLSKRAILENHNDHGQTPLHLAVISNNIDVARTLLAAGANPELPDADGQCPLHIAAREDSCEMLRLLLEEHDTVIECVNDDGLTPLMVAALNGSLSACQYLLDADADVHATRDSDHASPLMIAFGEENWRTAELLLKNGADVDHADNRDWTCLHVAARAGLLRGCEMLLEYDAIVDIRAGDDTPLHIAIINGQEEIVEMLLEHGADVDLTAGDVSAMTLAVDGGCDEIATLLLRHDADPDSVDDQGIPVLYAAAVEGKTSMCEILLEWGADADAETPSGYNAVTGAAYRGHLDTLGVLLDHGASGVPPKALNGKWKNQNFAFDVSEGVKKEILQVLRQAKHS